MVLEDYLLKTKKEFNKSKETGDTKSVCRNQLDKACFQYDMAYQDFKDLARRTGSDKILRDKAFNIANNPKYDGYQRGLASMVYKFFDKKFAGSGVNMHANIEHPLDLATQKIAEELHKPIIRKF